MHLWYVQQLLINHVLHALFAKKIRKSSYRITGHGHMHRPFFRRIVDGHEASWSTRFGWQNFWVKTLLILGDSLGYQDFNTATPRDGWAPQACLSNMVKRAFESVYIYIYMICKGNDSRTEEFHAIPISTSLYSPWSWLHQLRPWWITPLFLQHLPVPAETQQQQRVTILQVNLFVLHH